MSHNGLRNVRFASATRRSTSNVWRRRCTPSKFLRGCGECAAWICCSSSRLQVSLHEGNTEFAFIFIAFCNDLQAFMFLPFSLQYCLTFINYFTKMVELVPIRTKCAIEVAEAFYSHVICRYGCPLVQISDQGREFCNQVMKALCQVTNVRHRVTSVYHPQANGLVGNMNKKTISGIIGSCREQHHWPSALKEIQARWVQSRCIMILTLSPHLQTFVFKSPHL